LISSDEVCAFGAGFGACIASSGGLGGEPVGAGVREDLHHSLVLGFQLGPGVHGPLPCDVRSTLGQDVCPGGDSEPDVFNTLTVIAAGLVIVFIPGSCWVLGRDGQMFSTSCLVHGLGQAGWSLGAAAKHFRPGQLVASSDHMPNLLQSAVMDLTVCHGTRTFGVCFPAFLRSPEHQPQVVKKLPVALVLHVDDVRMLGLGGFKLGQDQRVVYASVLVII